MVVIVMVVILSIGVTVAVAVVVVIVINSRQASRDICNTYTTNYADYAANFL